MSQISKFDFDEGVLVKGKGLEGITFILNYVDNVYFGQRQFPEPVLIYRGIKGYWNNLLSLLKRSERLFHFENIPKYTMSTEKATRYRRTKADITEDIRKAAIDQILKRGFSASLVTEIIKKAKIEPPVFYHRYKDLDEFFSNRVEAEAWKAMDGDHANLRKAVLEAYQDRLHLFEAGDTLEGGVKSIAAYGHTPGHTVFQKDSILVIADLIHGAALQLKHPDCCPSYDMDADAARQSRLRILEYARENHLTMYGMHLPAPGSVQFNND